MAITEIVTPTWLKNNFLYGIDLTDDDGNAYPDSLYDHAIDAAVATASAEFDLELMGPTTYVERHDTYFDHGLSYYKTHLMHRPVRTVDKLQVQYAEFESTEIPVSWVQISSDIAAQVQIVPGPEALGSHMISGGIPFLGISGMVWREYTPLWWHYTYTAGFESALAGTVAASAGGTTLTGTGTKFATPELTGNVASVPLRVGDYVRLGVGTAPQRVSHVVSDTEIRLSATLNAAEFTGETLTVLQYPADILECVGLIAAMLPLDTAGDLILGAGISRLNVGVDGLHQEVQTTSGVENSGYGARVIQYRRRLTSLIKTIRRRYNPPKVMVL